MIKPNLICQNYHCYAAMNPKDELGYCLNCQTELFVYMESYINIKDYVLNSFKNSEEINLDEFRAAILWHLLPESQQERFESELKV